MARVEMLVDENDDDSDLETNTKINLNPIATILSDEQVYGLARRNYPAQFAGHKQFDPEIVQALRKFFSPNEKDSLTNEKNLIKVFSAYCPALEPMCERFKEFIQKRSFYPLVTKTATISRRFIAEIEEHQANKTVNIIWMMLLPLRYSMAVSNISEQEIDLFRTFIEPHIFMGLLKGDGSESELQTILNIVASDTHEEPIILKPPILTDFKPNNMIYEELAYISLEGSKIIYPFFDLGKIGVSLIVRLYLQQVSPMGLIPLDRRDGKLAAHGVRASSGPFAFHDYSHASAAAQDEMVSDNILYWTEHAVRMGIDWQKFSNFYVPIATTKFNTLNTALLEMHDLFMRFLLPKHRNIYDRAMNGFFFATHEYPAFSHKTMDCCDLEQIINDGIDATKNFLLSNTAWESPDDPLLTSPVDGKSCLAATEEETKIKIVQHFLLLLLAEQDYFIASRSKRNRQIGR